MEIDLALTADAATIDSSGKLNLLGIFDRITVHHFPAQHGRISLVLRFIGGPADAGIHELAIRLLGPDGEEIVALDGELQVAPGRRSLVSGLRIPHVLNLDGLVFHEPGGYTFEISVDGKHQASLPMAVDGHRTQMD